MTDMLVSLGWDELRAGQFNALCQFNDVEAEPGRVVAVDRGEVKVTTAQATKAFPVRSVEKTTIVGRPLWVTG